MTEHISPFVGSEKSSGYHGMVSKDVSKMHFHVHLALVIQQMSTLDILAVCTIMGVRRDLGIA